MSVPKIVDVTYAIYQRLFKILLCKEYVERKVNNAPESKFLRNFASLALPWSNKLA